MFSGPGPLPPSLPGRGDGCRLAAPHPPALLGAPGPAGLGAPGGEQHPRGRRLLPAARRSPRGARGREPAPGLGYTVPLPPRPARNRATARLVHQCFGIPAKTRASELSILIEIAGLGTAGGCLYRFDFCCSGKHITND